MLTGISDELANKLQSVLRSAVQTGFSRSNGGGRVLTIRTDLGISRSASTFTLEGNNPVKQRITVYSSGYWSTGVCMVWLRHTCPACLHLSLESVQRPPSIGCSGGDLTVPRTRLCGWVPAVLLYPVNFGIHWHRNFRNPSISLVTFKSLDQN